MGKLRPSEERGEESLSWRLGRHGIWVLPAPGPGRGQGLAHSPALAISPPRSHRTPEPMAPSSWARGKLQRLRVSVGVSACRLPFPARGLFLCCAVSLPDWAPFSGPPRLGRSRLREEACSPPEGLSLSCHCDFCLRPRCRSVSPHVPPSKSMFPAEVGVEPGDRVAPLGQRLSASSKAKPFLGAEDAQLACARRLCACVLSPKRPLSRVSGHRHSRPSETEGHGGRSLC